jgi:hypothetical protein
LPGIDRLHLGNRNRVTELWRALIVCLALVLAYAIPRYVLTPETRPWQIWTPAALATALLVTGLVMRYWLWVFCFGLTLPIEVWRTLPTWRALHLDGGDGRRT